MRIGLVTLPARRLPVARVVLPGFKPVRIRLPVNFGPPISTQLGAHTEYEPAAHAKLNRSESIAPFL
jgi:hypothetical protein